ncbi:exportin 7 [Tieghemostelium lacteum]|uniref:Exportin 7 n=1 Tax=Tieghemostelium lacteum TaxID=361077 RepID=A0A151ZGH3_TIELA|nr:exportin 7 [Tieghemostelium lacteum]|eukprot:KYQ93071.1 exportin 7 [Tieghemostelium lacteum]
MSIKSQEDFLRFEELCNQFYSKPLDAPKIDEILSQYFLSPNFLNEYKQLLGFTKNSYVIAQICRGLTITITTYWQSLSAVQKSDMKTTIWCFIESLPPIESFAFVLLLKLNSRIIKYSWTTETKKNQIVEVVQKLLTQSPEHHILALKVLKDLISEFNDSFGEHLTSLQHRNISISLRDSVLLNFFQISLDSLNKSVVPDDKNNIMYDKMREQALELANSCLTFSFIKTISVEISEEVQTIQVPQSWGHEFENPANMALFFKIYKVYGNTRALDCLLQFISVRKSIFAKEDEKLKFLTNIISHLHECLKHNIGFQNENNHLAFSRILERLKSNYHLQFLVSTNGYNEWIDSLSTFTINTLKSPHFSPSSIYYLLSLWSKLVSSLTYIKGDPNKALLYKYTPSIIETFITNKIEMSSYSDEDDEILMDYEKMVEILEVLPPLGRLNYSTTCAQLKQYCDALIQQYQQEQNANRQEIIQRQLSWLVYIIGCMIMGRVGTSNEEYDKLDSELALRVFLLMSLSESKIQSKAHIPGGITQGALTLELSFLYFMQSFRKIYIGEKCMSSTNIYKHMTEQGAKTDHTTVFLSIIQKIGFNLKYWADESDMIKKSLDLFSDIANGQSTSQLLYDHKVTKDLLKSHDGKIFLFLEKPINTKNRTKYYTILSKLLYTDENIHLFDEFIKSFQLTVNELLGVPTAEAFRTEETKRKIIGLLRDLRGIISSTNSKRVFLLFFEWFNTFFSVLFHKILDVWVDHHDVINVLLKFMADFVLNKGSRMQFDNYSPNGFIIFRETSKILQRYGQLILNTQFSKSEIYKKKIKNIQTAMNIFSNSLNGNFCNFGVFELYGDNCFNLAVDIILKLSLCVPLNELMNFPRAAEIYSILLDLLCNNSQLLLDLNSQMFSHIMVSLHKCLESQYSSVSSTASNAIDKLISFAHFQRKSSKNPKVLQNIHRNFSENPQIISQFIDSIITILIKEDNYNLFIISKPLLACIIFSPESFQQVKQNYIQNFQAVSSPDKIEKIFANLTEDMQDNLETKNKNRFCTTNSANFRRDMKSLISNSRFF